MNWIKNLMLLICVKSISFLKLNRYNNKTYRVDDVAFDQNPRCTFPFHNGEQMSYVDYYKYGCNTPINLKLPMLSKYWTGYWEVSLASWGHLKVRFTRDVLNIAREVAYRHFPVLLNVQQLSWPAFSCIIMLIQHRTEWSVTCSQSLAIDHKLLWFI